MFYIVGAAPPAGIDVVTSWGEPQQLPSPPSPTPEEAPKPAGAPTTGLAMNGSATERPKTNGSATNSPTVSKATERRKTLPKSAAAAGGDKKKPATKVRDLLHKFLYIYTITYDIRQYA